MNRMVLQKAALWRVVLPLSLWGLILRFRHRALHDLWADEYYQIEILNRPIKAFLAYLPKIEYCSYLSGDFYLTYPFFHVFGVNKWGLAIPHMFSALLGYYLLYLICRRHASTMIGYLVPFLVYSFNGTLINHALEIRTYAVLPTLVLAVFYMSQKWMCSDQPLSKKDQGGLILFYVMAIWFHVYGIIMTVVILAFIAGLRLRDKDFPDLTRRGVMIFVPVLIIAMPLWCLSIFGEHNVYSQRSVFQYIPNPWVYPTGFLKAVFGNLMGHKLLYPLYLGLVAAFFLPTKERLKQIAFFSILIIIPLQILLLANLRTSYFYVQRHFIWVMPLLAILLGWCWETGVLYFRQKRVSV